jgi:hypothetical protein
MLIEFSSGDQLHYNKNNFLGLVGFLKLDNAFMVYHFYDGDLIIQEIFFTIR